MKDDSSKNFEIGQWIEAYDGYAQALSVAVTWYEGHQNIPEGCLVGDQEMTVVIYKKLCNFRGKGRMVVASCNARLCNPIRPDGKKIVDALLADSKIQTKFEKLGPPPDFGLVANFRYDIPKSDIDAVSASLNSFRDTLGTNFVFSMLADAIPILATPPHNVTFDPPPGMVKCQLQLLNVMFETRDKQRVFSALKWVVM